MKRLSFQQIIAMAKEAIAGTRRFDTSYTWRDAAGLIADLQKVIDGIDRWKRHLKPGQPEELVRLLEECQRQLRAQARPDADH
jgi:hypothetical protein